MGVHTTLAVLLINLVLIVAMVVGVLAYRRRPTVHGGGIGEPLVRAGFRGMLRLDGRDVALILGLVLLAFNLRVLSPVVVNIGSSGPGIFVEGLHYPDDTDPAVSPECNTLPAPPAHGKPTLPSPPDSGVGPSYPSVKVCGFVFDETYFTVDAADDAHQPAVSYFDPEPPLTKLLMAPPEQLLDYSSLSWRLSTMTFGSLLAGLLYMIALRLRRDRFFAFVAGLLVCIDGLAFVESRVGIIDMIAVFFVALLYYVFLLHWQARTQRQWRLTLYVMAVVCGLAFACKLTAVAPALIAGGFIVVRLFEPLLLRHIPWLRRIAGPIGAGEGQQWRDAAQVFPARRGGLAHSRDILWGQIVVLGQAGAAILGGIWLVLGIAFEHFIKLTMSTTDAARTADGGYLGLGVIAVGGGVVLFWAGLRVQDRIAAARTTIAVLELAMLVFAVLALLRLHAATPWPSIEAAVLLTSVVALWLCVFAPEGRAEFAAAPELPGHYRDSWRMFAHYTLALMLVGGVFLCSYSRYGTIAHGDVYHFTTGCNPRDAGVPVTYIETISPSIRVNGLHSSVDVPRMIYNSVDKFMADLSYQSNECHPHPFSSRWYSWPVADHPVLLYQPGVATTLPGTSISGSATITNMGNPAIWWFGILAVLATAWRMMSGPRRWRAAMCLFGAASLTLMIVGFMLGDPSHDDHNPGDAAYFMTAVHQTLPFVIGEVGMAVFGVLVLINGVIGRRFVPAFIIGGYEVAWLMWVPGNKLRVLFYYHALGMFLLMVLAIAYTLTWLRRSHIQIGDRSISLSPVAYGLIATMIAAFIFFYPIWTGLPLPQADENMRLWVNGW